MPDLLIGLADLIVRLDDCDAVVVDDRHLNWRQTATDTDGNEVPVFCSKDVVDHLVAANGVSASVAFEAYARMRQAGLIVVQPSPEELAWLSNGAQWADDGTLIESFEMKALRQSMARLRSESVLQISKDADWLERMRLAVVMEIRRLWSRADLEVRRACSLSDWMWRNVAPDPRDWSEAAELVDVARHFVWLLQPLALRSVDRRDEWKRWADQLLESSLLPGWASVVDAIAETLASQIEEWSLELEGKVDER
jgi:hypothetical protein